MNAETAPERVVHKRKTIKRIAVKPKQMLPLGRSARHKIIRPANKYQPRPSPQVVRAAAVTAAPKRVPGAPLAIFSAKVTLAETRKPELATLSSAELVRRATRDPVLRQKLASAANDWLNKAKREAGSTLQLR